MKHIISVLFGLGLMANAALLFIQAFQILKTKSSKGVSKFTFSGFALIQVIAIIHGIYQNDISLILGMVVSLIASISVIVLAVIYK